LKNQSNFLVKSQTNQFSWRDIHVVVIAMFFVVEFAIAQQNYTQEISGTMQSIEMVFVEGGTFTMGSDDTEKGRYVDEGPQHTVAIDDFWIGKFEITWDLYQLFVERKIDGMASYQGDNEVEIKVDAISKATPPYTDMSFGMGTNGCPAIGMTQYAANKFCQWLSAITGNFYRLPTEAEWEYASRAGTQSKYSFGDDAKLLDEYGWYQANSEGKYHKVGQKKPNPWGLYDMHGNVAEWTLDQYLPNVYETRTSITINPLETPTNLYPRSVRGGSWRDFPEKLRSAARGRSSSTWKVRDPQIPKSIWWHTDADFVGFRIVRPKKIPSPIKQKMLWDETSN